MYSRTDATFAFTASDDYGLSHTECAWDSPVFGAGLGEVCESPVSASDLSEGVHTFTVWAVDDAGNVGAAVTHTWNIDLAELTFDNVRWVESAVVEFDGLSWQKVSGIDNLFVFEADILNSGADTVDSFDVGIVNQFGLTDVMISISWNADTGAWEADGSYFSYFNGNTLLFAATAAELGVAGPEADTTDKNMINSMGLCVDCADNIEESMEGDNVFEFNIMTVRYAISTPSFGLTAVGLMVSGLLAAAGITRNRKED